MKIVLALLLFPIAWIFKFIDSPLQRLWAFVKLGAALNRFLDPSIIILKSPQIAGTKNITLGKNLYLEKGLYWETNENGKIIIGDNVVMSRGVHIVSHSNITIGKGTLIGEYSSIRDANHCISASMPIRNSGFDSKPIIIGNNVWIGRGVMILPGVKIGDNAVIGANAVVSKDVAPSTIVGGIPAKILN